MAKCLLPGQPSQATSDLSLFLVVLGRAVRGFAAPSEGIQGTCSRVSFPVRPLSPSIALLPLPKLSLGYVAGSVSCSLLRHSPRHRRHVLQILTMPKQNKHSSCGGGSYGKRWTSGSFWLWLARPGWAGTFNRKSVPCMDRTPFRPHRRPVGSTIGTLPHPPPCPSSIDLWMIEKPPCLFVLLVLFVRCCCCCSYRSTPT
ncbi:hypothetical protein CGRA01v4_01185 [Colletotrichum graminicola]|nr:hypothetical protein CGRA01v4_01185 [Colletotrichum graminicola]